MKFSITVTLKKDVLDPQGKVVQNTLFNLGFVQLKSIRQGKFFEVELNEENESDAKNKIKQMCEKLLVNQIIEDFKIDKI